jgi:hydroxyacylglutathione hydrolase
MVNNSDLYFQQVLVGPMANFVYLIGSLRTRECMVVDPAWDTQALIDLAAKDDMKITGALVTHYHPDHIGGDIMGFRVPSGVADLIGKVDAKIHVHKLEGDGVKLVSKVSENDLVRHESGDNIELGDVTIQLIHTPGHTPGSQCFLVHEALVAGDTLFVNGCGRVDLPGSDPDQMYETLTQKLWNLDDNVVLFPGHDYGPTPTSTMGEQKQSNHSLRMRSRQDWLRLMGSLSVYVRVQPRFSSGITTRNVRFNLEPVSNRVFGMPCFQVCWVVPRITKRLPWESIISCFSLVIRC